MRRALVCCCAAAIVAAAVTVGPESSARPSEQELDAARALAISGRKLFKAGDYDTAIKRFHGAENIVHAPAHVLYLARAHALLGRLVEAQSYYQQIVDEELPGRAPPAFLRAQDKARSELRALEPRVPAVDLTISGPPPGRAVVTIDGGPVPSEALGSPVPLDPGEHEIAVSAPGWVQETRTIELTEGATETLDIELHAGASPTDVSPEAEGDDEPGGGLPIGPFVLLGVGGASLIVGGVTGMLALAESDELHDRCPPNPCPAENEELEDEAKVFATVSTVGFVVGGVAAAGGLAWLLFGSDDSDDDVSHRWLRPQLGPTSIGLGGTF